MESTDPTVNPARADRRAEPSAAGVPPLPPRWTWPSTTADSRCGGPDPAGPDSSACAARQDYVIVVDNSDSIQDSWNDITNFMDTFIDQLNYASGGPQLAMVSFSGPPIGQGQSWYYDHVAATNVLIDFSTDAAMLHAAVRNRVNHYGMTCISCGLDRAADLIRASARYGVAEPIVILLTDGEQTVGGTSLRAIDSAIAMRSNLNVRLMGVSYMQGAGNEVAMAKMVSHPPSICFMVRAPPSFARRTPRAHCRAPRAACLAPAAPFFFLFNSLNLTRRALSLSLPAQQNEPNIGVLMGNMRMIRQILCAEIQYVCQTTSTCEEAPDITVHGRGMLPLNNDNMTCTVGTQTVIATPIATTPETYSAMRCDFDTAGPRPDVYPYPQVLPVTISMSGGAFQTVLNLGSRSILPCTGPPPEPPPTPPSPPPLPPPMSCSNTCNAGNGVCQDGAPSTEPRTAPAREAAMWATSARSAPSPPARSTRPARGAPIATIAARASSRRRRRRRRRRRPPRRRRCRRR